MKKYLIKGLLALFGGAFLASCTDHDVEYVPIAQLKSEAYNQAFKEMIGGDVDPNQDWGFEDITAPDSFDPEAAARANTRNNGSINVNGNEWTGAPAVEVPGEVNAIYNYVKYTLPVMDQMGHHYATQVTDELNGYFVTQVRNGLNGDNVYPLTYDVNNPGREIENVGEKMNHLQIAFNRNHTMSDLNNATQANNWNTSGWEHINNFNASQNANWANDQSELHGNTKVENEGAWDFAYHNSFDDKYHNNWILVDGYYITDDHRFQNFYYVCFDFESTPQCVSKLRFKYNGEEYPISVNGAYTAKEAVDQNLAVTIWPGGVETTIHLGTDIDTSFKSGTAGVYNGLQVESIDNGDKMVYPDDIHTDWIIRITKGPRNNNTNTTTTYRMKCKRLAVQGRVFCEDLGQAGLKDLDFNDIVYDARIWWTYEFDRVFDGTTYTDKNWANFRYEAEICLLAAGGTISSKVAGKDVHGKFGVGVTTMVNTLDGHSDKDMVTWENMSAEKPSVTFTYDMTEIIASNNGNISLNLIPIEVMWTNKDANKGTMQTVGVLEANLGKVPHKICAPIGTVWPSERKNIKDTYPDFEAWATDRTTTSEFHNNPVDDNLYIGVNNGVPAGLPTTDAYGREIRTVNDGNIYTNYVWEEVKSQSTYSETETDLWSSVSGYAYNHEGTGADNFLTLFSTTFSTNDYLRVYCTKQADTGWITFHYDEGGWKAIVSSGDQGVVYGNGYIDIPVNSADKASHLSNGPTLLIAAKDITITKIAKLVVSTQ